MITSTVVGCALAIAGGDIARVESAVEAPAAANAWKQSISIYGWFPSLDGTLTFNLPQNPGDPEEEAEADILDNLDMVFMGSYTARKDQWSFFADMTYLNMSDYEQVYFPDTTLASDQELTGWLLGV